MAQQTPRFALNYFGNDIVGDFTDDSDKFTGADRLTTDRLLAALEKHSHHHSTALAEPNVVPDLGFSASGGALEAGTTYYYVISFVNTDGLETISGPEASIDLPDLLPTPASPQGETSHVDGNTLGLGQVYYAITGLRDTEESPLGDPTITSLVLDENTVTLTLPDLDAAESYQIWRMKDGDGGYTRIGTSATGTFVDDGSVPSGAFGDPANIAPTATTGAASYSVTVALASDDATEVQNTAGWRIYRSNVSGYYSAASLVHEVVERTDELDPSTSLLTEWLDTGDQPLVGSPKAVSQELDVAPFVFDSADTLPAAAGYANYYPIVVAGILYYNASGTWTPIGGGGGGGGTAMRGVATFIGHGPPDPEPADALAGDLYIDLDTSDAYELFGPVPTPTTGGAWAFSTGTFSGTPDAGTVRIASDFTGIRFASANQAGDAHAFLVGIVPGDVLQLVAEDDSLKHQVWTVSTVTDETVTLAYGVVLQNGSNTVFTDTELLDLTVNPAITFAGIDALASPVVNDFATQWAQSFTVYHRLPVVGMIMPLFDGGAAGTLTVGIASSLGSSPTILTSGSTTVAAHDGVASVTFDTPLTLHLATTYYLFMTSPDAVVADCAYYIPDANAYVVGLKPGVFSYGSDYSTTMPDAHPMFILTLGT